MLFSVLLSCLSLNSYSAVTFLDLLRSYRMKLQNHCMKPLLLVVFIIAAAFSASAQTQKEAVVKKLPAIRTTQKIVIDGDLKDEAWKTAPVATDMVEWRPSYGKIEEDKNRTEIRILYDNSAIYIGGFCHEASNDSISTELVGRDVVGVNDLIMIGIKNYSYKIMYSHHIAPHQFC